MQRRNSQKLSTNNYVDPAREKQKLIAKLQEQGGQSKMTLKQFQECKKMQQDIEQQNQQISSAHQDLQDLNSKFQLLSKIGQGGFGFVYRAIEISTGKAVAIKFEKKSENVFQQKLVMEAQLMELLNVKTKNNFGFPQIKEYKETSEFSYLVTTLLGFNLQQLLEVQQNRQFSLKTVCMIAYELINRLEAVHSKNFVYRDIKPENIMIGKDEECRQIFLIDFGLAKQFKLLDGKHIEEKHRSGLVGTLRYASLNSHQGKELSRRDDFESLGYMLIYLLKGNLPWMKLLSKEPEILKKEIFDMKKIISNKQLCLGLPEQFLKYFQYVKRLEFKQRPDYKYLRKLFCQIMKSNSEQFDYRFDWEQWIRSKEGIKYMISLSTVNLVSESVKTPLCIYSTYSMNDSMHSSMIKKNARTSFKQFQNDLNQIHPQFTLKLSVSRIPYCTVEWDIDESQNRENFETEVDIPIQAICFPLPKLIQGLQNIYSNQKIPSNCLPKK